jgi:hypothetical protein
VSEEGKNSPDWQFAMLSKHSRAPWSERASAQRGLAVTGSYDPAPLNEQEMERYYLPEVGDRVLPLPKRRRCVGAAPRQLAMTAICTPGAASCD